MLVLAGVIVTEVRVTGLDVPPPHPAITEVIIRTIKLHIALLLKVDEQRARFKKSFISDYPPICQRLPSIFYSSEKYYRHQPRRRFVLSQNDTWKYVQEKSLMNNIFIRKTRKVNRDAPPN